MCTNIKRRILVLSAQYAAHNPKAALVDRYLLLWLG